MKIICTFNTFIASRNTGDKIIMDSVKRELQEIFPNDFHYDVTSHEHLLLDSHLLLQKADHKIVGGTNMLSSNMPFYNQWKITWLDGLFLSDVTLMGVGWWQYQSKPNIYTRTLLKKVLSSKKIHSVRDQFTADMLQSIGISNVVNTTCPTMWKLTPSFCKKIPKKKANKVVFTLTSYKKDQKHDKAFVQALRNEYKSVIFWPQQPDDLSYFSAFKNVSDIEVLAPNLFSFDAFLEKNKTDYVGTRLHAGIRALNKTKRSLILAVDNRAKEISRDTNLPVIERSDTSAITKWINTSEKTSIVLPTKNIKTWKQQF